MIKVKSPFKCKLPDKLFIDKISITYTPPIAEQEYIKNTIKNVEWLNLWTTKKKKSKKFDDPTAYITTSNQYKSVLDLWLPDDDFQQDNLLMLELDSWKKETAFMRIEYNPSRISFNLLSVCLKHIMPDGLDSLFEGGKVTRLDIAMDIEDVKPFQLILDYGKMRFRTCYLESGIPNSIYIGKDTGENQIYMYDKIKEMKNSKTTIKPFSNFQPPKSLTRIELRHRPNSPTPKLTELLHLENLLTDKMHIIGPPAKLKLDTDFNLKHDLCVLKGIKAVLKQLTPTEQDDFKYKLMKFSAENFLDFNKLWETLPAALQQVYPLL